MAIRLYNKSKRTIQYQALNIMPNMTVEFDDADKAHADYLLKCFPGELEDAEKAVEKFNNTDGSVDTFQKQAPTGTILSTAHPLALESAQANGVPVIEAAEPEDDAPDGQFSNAKAEAYAKEQNIDVSQVAGTGRDGRITIGDLRAHAGK